MPSRTSTSLNRNTVCFSCDHSACPVPRSQSAALFVRRVLAASASASFSAQDSSVPNTSPTALPPPSSARSPPPSSLFSPPPHLPIVSSLPPPPAPAVRALP
eukprot:2663184-Rhodomonas_salina.2